MDEFTAIPTGVPSHGAARGLVAPAAQDLVAPGVAGRGHVRGRRPRPERPAERLVSPVRPRDRVALVFIAGVWLVSAIVFWRLWIFT